MCLPLRNQPMEPVLNVLGEAFKVLPPNGILISSALFKKSCFENIVFWRCLVETPSSFLFLLAALDEEAAASSAGASGASSAASASFSPSAGAAALCSAWISCTLSAVSSLTLDLWGSK
eukprot:CAMPEP_0178423590 /NCGR_PEP_ID=MMETSP0689_2-20121128/27767_1 /TAXON_ID=160604 /ORGANISM="Amphidinium massartii, Strain CS-259" /LENGTH=118 /DNA_ID=CAMNT_0020045189 /DNA_START=158 /DNA_END=514 /DNA_ORIENTATION=-